MLAKSGDRGKTDLSLTLSLLLSPSSLLGLAECSTLAKNFHCEEQKKRIMATNESGREKPQKVDLLAMVNS